MLCFLWFYKVVDFIIKSGEILRIIVIDEKKIFCWWGRRFWFGMGLKYWCLVLIVFGGLSICFYEDVVVCGIIGYGFEFCNCCFGMV